MTKMMLMDRNELSRSHDQPRLK